MISKKIWFTETKTYYRYTEKLLTIPIDSFDQKKKNKIFRKRIRLKIENDFGKQKKKYGQVHTVGKSDREK